MTIVERIRGIADRTGAAHAYQGGNDGDLNTTLCAELVEAPYVTVRRVQIALREGCCPLCFWALVRSFGLVRGGDHA